MGDIYYTIYKITNRINGKIYIGSHKTVDLDDGYMGSGKYLKRAIEKHGLENFEKEILHVFSSPEEMYAKEAELVNEEFIEIQNTYNLKVGGFGGFDYLNSSGKNFKHGNRQGSNRNLANGRKLNLEIRRSRLEQELKELDPRCRHCDKAITAKQWRFSKRNPKNIFCSHRCSATFNNRLRT